MTANRGKAEKPEFAREWLALASVPKTEKELAYRWELDRHILSNQYPVLPHWTDLEKLQRGAVRRYCERHHLWGAESPENARFLAGVAELENFILHEMEHHENLTSASLVQLKREARSLMQENGHPIGAEFEEDALTAKLPHDKDGFGYVAFRYDPKCSLDEIMADMRKEMETLRSFPQYPPKPRGKNWASRLIDLFCYQAKTQGRDWKESALWIDPCINAAACGGALSHKTWLTRISRADEQSRARRDWLTERSRTGLAEMPVEEQDVWKRHAFMYRTILFQTAPDVWGTNWASVMVNGVGE